MAFAMLLKKLLKDESVGRRIVPIIEGARDGTVRGIYRFAEAPGHALVQRNRPGCGP